MSGYVYVWGGQGIYKIGKAKNPHTRIQQFPIMPYPCDFAHILPTDNPYRLESYLHTHFSTNRIRGEWFNLSEQELQQIPQLAELSTTAPVDPVNTNPTKTEIVPATTTCLFAERVNWLFQNIVKVDGTAYSLQDVEDGTEALGQRVSTSNLHRLRHGEIPNPGYFTIGAIANFFQVPLKFFDPDLTPEEFKQIRVNLVRPVALAIAIQAATLNEEDRNLVLRAMDALISARNLVRQATVNPPYESL